VLPTKFHFIWLLDQSETRIACGGHACKRIRTKWVIVIDASYQVSVHLHTDVREDVLEIDQSKTRIACGCHVC
jgi:hypothetical protein